MRTDAPGFWWRSLGGPPPPREPLRGPAEVDVAIVGAGYTGLWTAYYLKHAQPSLRVAVLERERAGFGASGRNGGWGSGFFSRPAPPFGSARGRARPGAPQPPTLRQRGPGAGVPRRPPAFTPLH